MSLSQDAELFKRRVQNAPISGNIDNPEGGFDALMQVYSNQFTKGSKRKNFIEGS